MTAKKQRSLTQILVVVVVAFSAKYDQMNVSLLPFAALLSVLFGAAAHGGHDPGHDHHRDLEGPGRRDCAAPDPTEADRARADANMIETFGKKGNAMSRQELSAIVQDVVNGKKKKVGNGRDEDIRSLQVVQSPAYSLVDLPIVYHVLTKQHIPKADPTLDAVRPSATAAQLAFMTNKTNELFNIYSKVSKTSAHWASFIHSQTIYHVDVFEKDCSELTSTEIDGIIRDASNWEFKLHCIICESVEWSGVTNFPNAYSPTDSRHNLVRVEYRAIACYDEEGVYLCEPTAGQNMSHTRWWRTRSTVLAHELG